MKKRARKLRLGTLLMLLVAGSAFTQRAVAQGALNWIQAPPGAPSTSARSGHGMVFDATRGKVVVFGGLDASGNFLNDMWQWDSTAQTWSLMTPATSSVPLPRANFAIAYDVNRSKIVLYGGNVSSAYSNVGIIGDTWEFDSATLTWSKIPADTLAYVGLWGAQAAYDPNLKQVILFGGQPYWGIPENGNTYAWSGTAWKMVASTPAPGYTYNSATGYVCTTPWGPGPVGRVRLMMATDTRRSRVALFGGHTRSCANADLGDTWEWDGHSWTQVALSGATPGTRRGSGFTYDTALGASLLFGGWSDSTGMFGDTWGWDGTKWTQQTTKSSPSPRWTDLAYDAAIPNIIMFGGDASASPSVYNGSGGGASALGETWFVITPATTTILLTSSKNPAGAGDNVTFTATVSASSGTPTGTVAFFEGATPLGTQKLSSGQAAITIEDADSLGVGSFSITVNYTPDASSFLPSSVATTQTVSMLGVAGTSGNNTFTGNQTVNGTVNATSFMGDGSRLVGVNAASLGGVAAGNYARLDVGNSFNGNQNVAGNVVANGNVTSGSIVTAPVVSAGSVSAGAVGVTGNITANGTVAANQDVTAGGNVNATAVATTKIFTNTLSTTGPVSIGGGTPIVEHLSMLIGASMAPNSCGTFSFPGAADGDTLALGIPNSREAGGLILYYAWANAPGTIEMCNFILVQPQTGLSGAIRVDIWKH